MHLLNGNAFSFDIIKLQLWPAWVHGSTWRLYEKKISNLSQCFFSAPDRRASPSCALMHESFSTLSTGHLGMSYLPWASPIHYSDRCVSGDEEKVKWLTAVICCLTSWQFSGFIAKGRIDRSKVLLSFLGEDRPLPTDQLLKSLNWQSAFFLPQRI